MKLTLTTDQGTVLNIWEDLESWNLLKLVAQATLADEIMREVEKGMKIQKEEEND
jgi:hypothetical protein